MSGPGDIGASRPRRFVVCIRNDGYGASLELRKIYEVIPDAAAERSGWIRVIDESGGDYVYPREFFASVELPGAAQAVFRRAS